MRLLTKIFRKKTDQSSTEELLESHPDDIVATADPDEWVNDSFNDSYSDSHNDSFDTPLDENAAGTTQQYAETETEHSSDAEYSHDVREHASVEEKPVDRSEKSVNSQQSNEKRKSRWSLVAFTLLSTIGALLLLGVLLLLATSTAPETYRQIDRHVTYLEDATQAVERGVEVTLTQNTQLGSDAGQLSQGLQQGLAAMEELFSKIYEPSEWAEHAQWPVMRALNIMDVDAGALVDPASVNHAHRLLISDVERLDEQLEAFSGPQVSIAELSTVFISRGSRVASGLRGAKQSGLADDVFVNTEKVKSLVQAGSSADLDAALVVIAKLESVDAHFQNTSSDAFGGSNSDEILSVRSNLGQLIDDAYVMVSLRRSMNQAQKSMDLAAVKSSLGRFRDLVGQDQMYVVGAVSDARVLLNMYTVLMLLVLGYFGLRLRNSHVALNRSHEDLEVRVEERTRDLAQANEDLKESQVQLVQAEKMSSLGQLVAGVMHEINTPLLYVLNNTTMTSDTVTDLAKLVNSVLPIVAAQSSDEGKLAMKRFLAEREQFDVEELSEAIEEVSSLAEDSVDGLNQISELVQSLKDFSRLDRVADDRFDVRDGIEKTLTITRNLLKYGVKVEKNLSEVPEIFCSPSRLNQVFINIVTNAVQAMDGEGTLTISTQHVQSSKGEWVEAVFEDTGCGIPEENLQKIMDPFFTTKAVGEGTGLGMSIVAQIIEQHGGQILVDSKVGKGTRIAISLPIRDAAALTRSEDSSVEAA